VRGLIDGDAGGVGKPDEGCAEAQQKGGEEGKFPAREREWALGGVGARAVKKTQSTWLYTIPDW